MVKIIWTELALADLKVIHNFISNDSKFYADRFVAKLIESVDKLGLFPNLGRVVPEFGDTRLREIIEGNYRLIYKVHVNYIGIVRIHHSSRQLKK